MVRFRTFSPRAGHWFDDNSLYRESQAGRITWTFGASAVPRKPNPFTFFMKFRGLKAHPRQTTKNDRLYYWGR
jgi:hypothetical protein